MKGLLLRDFYQVKNRSTVWMLALFVSVMVMMMINVSDPEENSLFQCRIFGGMVSMFSMMISMALLAGDEHSKWINYAMTTPVSRKTYIAEKYIISLAVIVLTSLLISLFSLVLMLRQGEFVWKEYLLSLAIGFFVPAFMLTVLYPLSLRFSASKGAAAFLVIFILIITVIVFFFISTAVTDVSFRFIDLLKNTDPGLMAFCLFLAGAALLGASWPLSLFAFRHRQF